MPDITPVTLALVAKGIPHTVFQHPGPVHSLEQAARERGQRPEQVVRSIVFRLAEDSYVMVLMAGALRVRGLSWRTPVPAMHFWRSLTGVASLLLNLDETISKE